MHYDATFKELLHNAPRRLLELLTGSQPRELLTIEYPAVRVRRPDLVSRLADGRLHHLELFSEPDPHTHWRMLEYYFLLGRHFKEEPFQQALYVGRERAVLTDRIEHQTLRFRYQVIDMRDFDAADLLESASLEDNLLAILYRLEDPRQAVRQILSRIGLVPGKARADAMTKLLILSRLRGLPDLVAKEERQMPIRIDSDILDDLLIRDLVRQKETAAEARGEARGEARSEISLLRRQLERRFGPLPQSALERLEASNPATRETWALRLLDAGSLEDVLQS